MTIANWVTHQCHINYNSVLEYKFSTVFDSTNKKDIYCANVYHVNHCRAKLIKYFEHACFDTLKLITQAYVAGFDDCDWNN